MPKNYYLTLGIPADASYEEIKLAFQRRALELHPDRSGLESEPFAGIQEARSVPADPESRRRYDEETSAAATRPRRGGPAPEPLGRQRPRAEPFRPILPPRGFREVSLAESFETYHPSFDELFARLWSNFEAVSRPKAEQLENLTVEIVLGPEEACLGGRVRVWIPARAVCSRCGGHGAVGPYECWRCEGQGAITIDCPLEVAYPAGIRDGHAIRLPLTRYGIENFYLTVLLRVSGHGSVNL
jgi:DnaJ-class molecular chaperone